MYSLGLKLWSTNIENYLNEAISLYENNIFDYVELYVVPDTMETACKWKKTGIPFIIHNAHFAHGFNLARADRERYNYEVYKQSRFFADVLDADKIIFHGGIDGNWQETARQLKNLNEPRALLENKPMVALPNKMGGKICRGATLDELDFIITETGCSFCLDFGHAICSANAQGLNPYKFINMLLALKPEMFHLSNVTDLTSIYDSHAHLDCGECDLKQIVKLLPPNTILSLETEKDEIDNLNDFAKDASIFKNLMEHR